MYNSALNCEAYSSFKDVSIYRQIVKSKIQLSLRKNATRTKTTVHYDWALRNNRDIRYEYTLALRKKSDAVLEQTEIPTPNEEYENFVNGHLEGAAEFIPTKQRRKHRIPWETLVVRERRADVKTASKPTGRTQPIPISRNLKRPKMNLPTYT